MSSYCFIPGPFGGLRSITDYAGANVQRMGCAAVFRPNYSGPLKVLNYAYDFAKDFLQAQDADDHTSLIAPDVAGASGPEPQSRKFDTFNDEAHYIARCIRKWHQNGQLLNTITVIYGHHWQAETLQRALKAVDIPNAWLKSTADKKAYDANAESVALLTRQSSKGLEFDTVVLVGLGGLKDDEENLENEVRLLYVGMTRARQQLLLTGNGENWFVGRFGR
ncbi:3'-5' exonuclease [Alloalcanivorax xenomutans]|uniref:3'-5' exonuclease n=1 Tax=Alloalcanivorax xenomutans TaxID=1094342 RepID=UPI0029342720|nr:3'-5' exonuclease [Alloalcanivorax xenomutans]WOD29822.1 3'-5' exonuclease [Alloalcanivorax xenomutans]